MNKIKKCRVCGSSSLKTVFNLGEQFLTGVFPKDKKINPTIGPLELMVCGGDNSCQLTQLSYSFPPHEMYGEDYGYNTSLNLSMVNHIKELVSDIEERIDITSSDCVLDIGSNDATLLLSYKDSDIRKFGIDPSAEKFSNLYKKSLLAVDFFSKESIYSNFGNKIRFKVITAVSMFYDLDNPIQFLSDAESVLDDKGVIVLEQSYLLSMLETNSFDTVCHEHVEYYSIKQIEYIAKKSNLKIFDLSFSDANGGSFRVFLCKNSSDTFINASVDKCIAKESSYYANIDEYWLNFMDRIQIERVKLIDLIDSAKRKGKKVAILGASTKGNSLLQYYDLTPDRICGVGEVNVKKFDRYTPGTGIKIVNEDDLLTDEEIDFFIVLPWHFKNNFLRNPKYKGRKLVFPLPYVKEYIVK